MLSIIRNGIKELHERPIAALGAIAAVIALFRASPEIPMGIVGMDTPAGRTGQHGVVTWLILYIAVCFATAWFGSLIARGNKLSGAVMYPVLGLLAVTIGCYLASIHVASFELQLRGASRYEQEHVWFGMNVVWIGIMMSFIWTAMALACYAPSYDSLLNIDNVTDGGIYVFVGAGVLAVGLMLWATSYALILGLVPVVPEKDPLELTWNVLGAKNG